MAKGINRSGTPALRTDLSAETPSTGADINNHARTTVTDFTPELNRANRKIRKLEAQLAELRAEHRLATEDVSAFRRLVRRYRWALWTGFLTLEGKAAYGMSISEWGDQHWWTNLGQAVGLLIAAGYVVTPNVRKLLRLSSDVSTTDDSQA